MEKEKDSEERPVDPLDELIQMKKEEIAGLNKLIQSIQTEPDELHPEVGKDEETDKEQL